MLLNLFEVVYQVLAASLTSYGMYLLFQKSIKQFNQRMRSHMRYKKQVKAIGKKNTEEKERNFMIRHLTLLIKATSKDTKEGAVEKFIVFVLVFFLTTGIAVFGYTKDVQFSFFTGIILGLIPLFYRIIRLRMIRVEAGYDLAPVIGLLLSKYRKHNYDMFEALKDVIPEIKNVAIRQSFRKVLKVAYNYLDLKELEEEIQVFMYMVNTSFAKQLGISMLKALSDRTNVEKSIEAVDMAIQQNIQMLDDERSHNSELIQFSWLHLIAFPGTIALTFMFAKDATLELQFKTEDGRFWFSASVISILVSLFISLWFKKPQNDI